MSKSTQSNKKSTGHNGYIWSQRSPLATALLLAALLALSLVGPVLAHGIGAFG